MNAGWEIRKLGDVCIVERGSSPRPIVKYQTDSSDGVNWIKIGDTKGVDKYIYKTREKITKEGAEKSKYVKEGDFILSNSMSFGKPYIMKTDGYIHDGWFVFRLPDYLDKDFFYHLLTSPKVQNQIQSLGAGAIVKNISGDLVKRVDITYPKSLPEQHRIVNILDEAFAAIDKAKANAEKNLKNAKELFESYLQGVFENRGDDWEEKTLGEIGKPSMCKRILKHQTTPIGDIPFYKIGTFGKKPDAFISKALYDEFRNKYSFPKKGDVLISASGTIGRRVRYDGEPAFFQDSNIVWIDNDEKQVLNDYLYVFYEFCDWQPSKGATISRLYNSNLTSIKVSFPKSKEEQKILLVKIDALSAETKRLESIYQQKLTDLEELKKSILQKAFNGELNTADICV
jgi:type I restriction enzyme S subunit